MERGGSNGGGNSSSPRPPPNAVAYRVKVVGQPGTLTCRIDPGAPVSALRVAVARHIGVDPPERVRLVVGGRTMKDVLRVRDYDVDPASTIIRAVVSRQAHPPSSGSQPAQQSLERPATQASGVEGRRGSGGGAAAPAPSPAAASAPAQRTRAQHPQVRIAQPLAAVHVEHNARQFRDLTAALTETRRVFDDMAQLLARLEELAAQVDPTQWADARVQGAGARLGGGGGQTPPGAPLPADEFQRLCGRVVPTLNDASRLSAALVPFLARAAADPAGSGGNGTGGGWRPQSVGRPALPAPRGEAAPSTRQESPPRPSRGGGGGGGGDQEWLNMVQTTVDQGIAATLGTAQPGVHQDVLSALSSALRHALQSPRST